MSRVALGARPTPIPVELVDADAAASSVPRRLIEQIAVAPFERFVLAYVDGKRTIADVAALVGLSARETLHVILRLRSLGAVGLVHASGPYELEVDDSWDRPSDLPTMPGSP